MKILHRLVLVLVMLALGLGAGAMPAFADLGAGAAVMHAAPDSHGDGCAGHAQGKKKADTCCTQCPCCIALPSILSFEMPLHAVSPVAMPLRLPAGRAMAPEPTPPRTEV